MKTNLVIAAALAATIQATAPMSLAQAPWLKATAEVNFDATGKNSEDYELNLRHDTSLRFELILHEGIKAVVKARIIQDLVNRGEVVDSLREQEIEKVLEEAYIEINTAKFSNLPQATVIFGKQTMAFGQEMLDLPTFRDNLLYNLASEREMIGLTVSLPTKFLKVVDSVAISLYENGFGDLDIADEKAVSVKLSKKISQTVEAQISALIKENALSDENENRGSIGFVFTSPNRKTKVWANGLVFDNNPLLPDTRYGASVGASQKFGPGTIVVQYEYLQKNASEIAAAYNVPVGRYLTISPEVRHNMNKLTDSDDTRIGIRARLQLSTEVNRELLTGRK